MVHLFKEEKINDAQKRDPDLGRFIDLFNENTEKPQAKSLASKLSQVKILYIFLMVLNDCPLLGGVYFSKESGQICKELLS